MFAALNTATGEVIGQIHRRHRAVEFKKFLIRARGVFGGLLQVLLAASLPVAEGREGRLRPRRR
ncbi:hypothetical protein [Streptomyces sp. NL15-2K]|uniref:hypothetical protein n=1 Tax=Streptomyces sp. NL15-2K TaxID=376149 RepID=UPI000FF9432E|nr:MULTISPECIES: hypothetical protein [Actinomycetes]WKX06133.1 hypothetical protein Q4V64_00980 [Kutzneria buriramensis]GCB42826.1 mobile element protein [Streptomyces sp. NL15-2K]